MNRLVPLRVWGPSGTTPEYGTTAALEHMKQMYIWDIGTRSGVIDFRSTISFSDFTLSGREPLLEVVEPIYEEINEIYGTDYKPGL
jgi:hypothetical protein